MQKVIFDSSFLMAVADKPTPWEEDIGEILGLYEPVLLDCVRSELEGLARNPGTRAKLARVALSLTRSFSSRPCGGARTDDEIISAALNSGGSVATLDEDLKLALSDHGVRVILLKLGRVATA